MKVSKVMLAVLVVGLVVGAGFLVDTAYAQGNNPPGNRPFPGRGLGARMMLAEGDHPLHEYLIAAFSEALGLSESVLESRLDAGETMIDIALSTGLSQDEAWALIQDAHQAALEAAQADGLELPAFGRLSTAPLGAWDGDCPMDGDGPSGRGRFGMHGFAGTEATE